MDFTTVLQNIMNDREEVEARRRAAIEAWAEEIDRIDSHIRAEELGPCAVEAIQWIAGSNFSEKEFASVFCALFRELRQNSYLHHYRTAMASLADMASDFGGES